MLPIRPLAKSILPIVACSASAAAAGEITPAEFRELHDLIKPQGDEFAWYDEIPWMTRVHPARAKAAAEGKPLLIWTSADGQPCGAG